MCDSVYEEMILPCDVVNRLLESRDSVHVTNASANIGTPMSENIDASMAGDTAYIPVDTTTKNDDLQLRRANAETLRSEQVLAMSLSFSCIVGL